MPLFQLIDTFERQFSPEAAKGWMKKYSMVSWCFCAVYVFAVFMGRWYMRDKPALNFRRTLIAWNASLAALSAVGAYMLLSPLVEMLSERGLTFSVCHTSVYTDPRLCLWLFVFVLFKVVELGDTAFVVLKKAPVTFLHCYHHVTVLLYCWWGYDRQPAVGHWFSALNYGVHAIMYGYYAVKGSGGFRLPLWVSQCITTLQMSQFLIGLGSNCYAYYLVANGIGCAMDQGIFYTTIGIYGSYFLLFANFFYQRYCKVKA